MKKYSTYEYRVAQIIGNEFSGLWSYEIFGEDSYGDHCMIRESDEWYMTALDADLAAQDHIDKLESGEG